MIVSRTDPLLPLGRWRGRGQLHNLRAQEMRFSLEEALTFLNGSMGLSLSPENVAELDQHTEGWVAGLQMAAFALQDKDEAGVDRVIQAFSGRHHFLLDYFTDEILQRQSKEIQNFLLQTSVLERMCAELCATVISDGENTAIAPAQAQTMLEYLELANQFVVPLDMELRWYRYHHLFNDLLLARLRQASGQFGEADLRRRAARWHARQGHLSEAVHQAMQAQDYDLAAGLIESPAQFIRIFETGQVAPILKWTQELPPDVIRKHLWLKLYQSHSLFYTGKTDAAEAILDEIEQDIRLNPDQVPQWEILLGMVLSHKARYASVRGQVGPAARGLTAHAPYPHCGPVYDETNAIWEIRLASTPNGVMESAAENAQERLREAGELMRELDGSGNGSRQNAMQTLLDRAHGKYQYGLQLQEKAAAEVGCEALCRLSSATRQFNHAQVLAAQAVQMVVPPVRLPIVLEN